MKITLIQPKTPTAPIFDYPVLMKWKSDVSTPRPVVLFTSEDKGIRMCNEGGPAVRFTGHSETWEKVTNPRWERFAGKVTLSN